MTPQQYYAAINQATLQGFSELADALYMLYRYDYPALPRRQEGVPVGQCRDPYRKDYVATGIRCGDLSGCSQ